MVISVMFVSVTLFVCQVIVSVMFNCICICLSCSSAKSLSLSGDLISRGFTKARGGLLSGSSRSKSLKIRPSDPSELDRIVEGHLSLA